MEPGLGIQFATPLSQGNIMVTHTPGPWTNPHWDNGFIRIRAPSWHSDSSLDSLAKVYPRYNATIGGCNEFSIDEAEANARLIVAAPELLAACKCVLESLDRNLAIDCLPETREALRAVITKADGIRP